MTMNDTTIRILLADDHRMLREGIKSLINREPDMHVIAEAKDGREAIMMVERFSPDVVILDISMPHLNGVEATRQITGCNPAPKVIALSMHNDQHYIRGMFSAGASGYLLKSSAFEELTHAIREIVKNNVFVSSEITGVVINDYAYNLLHRPAVGVNQLTSREREILQLLAEGAGTKDIAQYLNISSNTVDSHRKHVMTKLGLNSIAELTKYAVKNGITTLDI